MTEVPAFLRDLWAESRPSFVQQAHEAVEAAGRWSATGDREAFEALRHRAHKMAGALGSFAAALRPAPPDSPYELAASDARTLNEDVSTAGPDAPQSERERIVVLAERLSASLDATA